MGNAVGCSDHFRSGVIIQYKALPQLHFDRCFPDRRPLEVLPEKGKRLRCIGLAMQCGASLKSVGRVLQPDPMARQ